MTSPRDRFVTVFGRQPVREVLVDEALTVDKLLMARNLRGPAIDDLVDLAQRRGIPVERVDATRVTRISGNGRHDQGVVADVEAPGLAALDEWLADAPPPIDLLVLDGVTNPSNVGMAIRSAAAAGAGTVLPRHGSPDLGPLVLKASAGLAFRATILRAATASDAVEALAARGWTPVGLEAGRGPSLYEGRLPARTAFVVGGETEGLSTSAEAAITEWRSIPLAAGVESLNVATAATLALFEGVRRRAATSSG